MAQVTSSSIASILLALLLPLLATCQTWDTCERDLWKEAEDVAIIYIEAENIEFDTRDPGWTLEVIEGENVLMYEKDNAFSGVYKVGDATRPPLCYPVEFKSTGYYWIEVRNWNYHNTEHNDIFLKFNNTDWLFLPKANDPELPNAFDTAKTRTGYQKAYRNAQPQTLRWDTFTIDHDGHKMYIQVTEAPFVSEICLKPRSTKYGVDAIRMRRVGAFKGTWGYDTENFVCLDNATPAPTTEFSSSPTGTPSIAPSTTTTESPTRSPISPSPTTTPTSSPTTTPSSSPTTVAPSMAPSSSPTSSPITSSPTSSPITSSPTEAPTSSPTNAPSLTPSACPTTASPITSSPTLTPTNAPVTASPTNAPVTASPTSCPLSASPTASPITAHPVTIHPTTLSPSTVNPTVSPTTLSPITAQPSLSPTTSSPITLSPTTQSPVTSTPTALGTEAVTIKLEFPEVDYQSMDQDDQDRFHDQISQTIASYLNIDRALVRPVQTSQSPETEATTVFVEILAPNQESMRNAQTLDAQPVFSNEGSFNSTEYGDVLSEPLQLNDDDSNDDTKLSLGVIFGIIAGGIVLLGAIATAIFCYSKRSLEAKTFKDGKTYMSPRPVEKV